MSDWHVSFLLFSFSVLCYCFPLFSGMFCLVGFLQDGIEDTEMFYILQMACDHNCTAEGSCWDFPIGCAVLRDHPTLCVGAACGWIVLCHWIDVVPRFSLKPVTWLRVSREPGNPPVLTLRQLELHFIPIVVWFILESLVSFRTV